MIRKLAFTLIFAFSSVIGGKYFPANNVEVRVQAENSFVAQQRAQSSAMMKGFSRMLKREFPDFELPAHFTFSEVSACMSDYSIDREKFSKTVFVGKFSFRFSREKVLRLLQKHGVAVSLDEFDSPSVRLIATRSDFIRNFAFAMKSGAVIEKFNANKVVFSVSSKNAEEIESKIVCVKL